MGFQARMLARIPSWPAVLPSSGTTRHSCTGKQAFHCEHLTAEGLPLKKVLERLRVQVIPKI